MKKKVEFEDLKSGQKFRYKRKLFIKDSDGDCAVQLSSGLVVDFKYDYTNPLVTPVKVKISEVK